MKGVFKCGNCRHILDLNTLVIANQHGDCLADLFTLDRSDTCADERYFIVESLVQQVNWIARQVELGEWKRGKLNCPHNCGAKLGSFNFVQQQRCACKQCLVSPLHLIKSRVDFHADE